jgi:SAM-dependent methyltransferase
MDGNEYWNSLAADWHRHRPQRLWRSYCDDLNRRLIDSSLSSASFERALKTDLFDEATGPRGLTPVLAGRAGAVVGIDLSVATSRFAGQADATLAACTADVRRLPFDAGSFDLVLSNSTLDHFPSFDDLVTSLGEIARVLRPGGRLLLTLDNLVNPVVALRRVLPYSWLSRLHLVPYFVGCTCGPRRLRRLLGEAGFRIRRMGSMMHCPRLPAVVACELMQRWTDGRSTPALFGLLDSCEHLARLPTRYLTGYFISVLAEREAGGTRPANS